MVNAIRGTFDLLWNLILTISVWDILDIIIVAFVIYKILTIVRRTNLANIVKGIVLLLLVVWLSSLLRLNMISYLLGQAMKMGILVLIILFQPELRRFLEQVGGGSSRLNMLKRPNKNEYIEGWIESTVNACVALSETKTGVLIAFERHMSLDDFIRTGTKIDSSISAELIENIFYPNTPLHDGAVIIKNGRIVAASCMLPLSSNMNLSRELGMRHRAGIGISERTDAVAAIVSEETGSISVAVGGMLKRHLSAETLEKLLKNELMPQRNTKSNAEYRKTRVKR